MFEIAQSVENMDPSLVAKHGTRHRPVSVDLTMINGSRIYLPRCGLHSPSGTGVGRGLDSSMDWIGLGQKSYE